MNRNIILTIVIIAVLIAGGSFFINKNKSADKAPQNVEAQEVIYTCPMHPEVKADKPSVCPICNMNLVKKK